MSDFFTCNVVKARKNHRCDLCWTTIDKNEYYVRGFCASDGSGFTQKCHRICQDIINHLMHRNFDEGIDFSVPIGEYIEGWLRGRYRELRDDLNLSQEDCRFKHECSHYWKAILTAEDIDACVKHSFEWCDENQYRG